MKQPYTLMAMGSTAVAFGLAGGSLTANASDTAHLIALVAANAADPFDEIVRDFRTRHPDVQVTPEYAGTQVLETQLEQGAPADLFLSADLGHIKRLQAEGIIGAYFLVSKGHEVIVVPRDNPAGIESLGDLAAKPNKLVLGVDAVPIGSYSRKIFVKAAAEYGRQFPQAVEKNVVSLESNVKQILQKVALGEADAGIVYRSDVTPAYADAVRMIEIPKPFQVESANYIAVVNKSVHARLAGELLKTATGPQGQRAFERFGYDPLR